MRRQRRSAVTRKFYTWEEDFVPAGRALSLNQGEALVGEVWDYARRLEQYRKRARTCIPPYLVYGPGKIGRAHV